MPLSNLGAELQHRARVEAYLDEACGRFDGEIVEAPVTWREVALAGVTGVGLAGWYHAAHTALVFWMAGGF